MRIEEAYQPYRFAPLLPLFDRVICSYKVRLMFVVCYPSLDSLLTQLHADRLGMQTVSDWCSISIQTSRHVYVWEVVPRAPESVPLGFGLLRGKAEGRREDELPYG